MQWDKLKIFYHVAKFQSISKAAQYLNVAQSAISRQIIDLENSLGYKLLNRLPKGVSLTREGQILFENTEKMFVYSELALTQIQDEQIEPQGDMSIGTNVGLVETWIYQLIPDFLKLYPNINLSIFSKDTPLDVESLEVQVALQPFDETQPDLIQNFLMSWHRKLYASKEYLKKYGIPRKTSDLENHKLLAYGPERIHLFSNVNWHLRLNNGLLQKPYLNSNSLRTLFHLGNSGIGIISFSQESPLLKDSNLIEILPECEGPRIDIYFSYANQLKNIKKVMVLENYLRTYVKNHHRKFISPPLLEHEFE